MTFHLQADFEEQSLHLRLVDEKFLRCSQEIKKMEEELMYERQNNSNEESVRKSLEQKIRDLEIRLENNSNAISANARKMLEKQDQKIRSLEMDLEQERRKCKENLKQLRQVERNCKDYEYQSLQDKRNSERFEEMISKLQDKNRMYKKLAENAEEMAALNLAKLRRAQAEADFEEINFEQAESDISLN